MAAVENQPAAATREETADESRPAKGRKGGKGGGKGGKGGKGYEGGPRRPRFTENAEYEKDERTDEELKADEEGLAKEIEKQTEFIDTLKSDEKQEEEQDRREKLMATVREEMDAARANKKTLEDELHKILEEHSEVSRQRQELVGQRKEILAEKTSKMKDLGVNYKEEDVVQAIKRLEHEHESRRSLSRGAETKLIQQIKQLEAVRHSLRDFRKYDIQAAEKDKVIKDLNESFTKASELRDAKKEEIKAISEEINKLRRKSDAMKGGNQQDLQAAEHQLQKLNKQLEAVRRKVNYRERKARAEEEQAEYEENSRKWKEEQEKKRAEEEEYRRKNDADYRERKERQAKRDAERAEQEKEIQELKKANPWRDETILCDMLIAYVTKAGGIGGEKVEKPKQLSEKEKMEAALRKISEANNGTCNLIGKKEATDDAWLFKMDKQLAPKSVTQKKAPVPAAEKVEKNAGLSHTLDKFEAFDDLKVDTPMTTSEIPAILEVLKKRKEWFATAAWDADMEDLRTRLPPKNTRREGKADRKGEGKGDRKGDRKGEYKGDRKGDRKGESKGEGKGGKGSKGGKKGGKKGKDGGKPRDPPAQ